MASLLEIEGGWMIVQGNGATIYNALWREKAAAQAVADSINAAYWEDGDTVDEPTDAITDDEMGRSQDEQSER